MRLDRQTRFGRNVAQRIIYPFLAFMFVLAAATGAAFAQSAGKATSCTRLAQLAVPEATITMSEVVEPMGFKLPATLNRGVPGGPVGRPGGLSGSPNDGPRSDSPRGQGVLPPGGMSMVLAPFDPEDTTNHVAFCRIAATLMPSGDSNIKIEVWLPLTGWNGKLMGAGNFGWAGSIMYGGLLLGLQHGFATVSTDAGHDNLLDQGAFALGHPDKMVDYGYRAAHTMTVDAKMFIKALYGEAPKHAYWFGCSLGGQMGLTEIERFPEDYDGAIIGAPASPIVELNAAQIWPSLLVAQNPARQLGREKAEFLHKTVMQACDELDGAKDGELEDPSDCHFDPKTLQCNSADDGKCLTAAQVEFVQMLYAGPANPRTGERIFEGAAYGTESNFGGYSGDNAMGVATALYKYMIFQDPKWDWKTLDMEKDIAYGRAALRTINEADSTNLKSFFDRGGKVLWYHGWNDGASPMQSAKYMNGVKQTVGAAKTENSFRLFAMPGMGHCYGGSGCDTFDKLTELDHWVESGKAPDRILASKRQNGKVIRTHPLCAYPATAKYTGTGSVDDAANFVCTKQTTSAAP